MNARRARRKKDARPKIPPLPAAALFFVFGFTMITGLGAMGLVVDGNFGVAIASTIAMYTVMAGIVAVAIDRWDLRVLRRSDAGAAAGVGLMLGALAGKLVARLYTPPDVIDSLVPGFF